MMTVVARVVMNKEGTATALVHTAKLLVYG